MRLGIGSLIVIFVFTSLARADEAEDRSAAFFKKIGGRVYRAEGKPGKPVISMDLVFAKFIDSDLRQLAGLQNLTTLDLNNTKVGDGALREVAALKQLEELSLCGTKVTPAGLKALAPLKKLKTISFNAIV